MADMVDVILASGLSSRGQIKTYAQLAAKAAAQANEAVNTANNLVNNLDELTQQTNQNNENAEQALQDAQTALTQVNNILNDVTSAAADEIDKLILSMENINGVNAMAVKLDTTYPDNTTRSISELVKFYKSTGLNEDGGMTQKAITEALQELSTNINITLTNQITAVDTRITNVYNELNNSINQTNTRITNIINNGGGSGGGTMPVFSPDDEGKVIIIGPDGTPIPSDNITEVELIEALIGTGSYILKNCVGLTSDYENRIFIRTQEAKNFTISSDFDKFEMYGGRMRCNVSDDGRIVAFYGDANYKDDGSNGQVMVYQPKFY